MQHFSSPHCCQPSCHWRRGSQLSSRDWWSWRPEPWWRGGRSSFLMRTQSSPFWISAWWWMKSFWESNVDDVPDLGVMGVHDHVQPLQEETRIRKHVNKVCSLWALNLDWDVEIFFLFRFAVFLKNRFVFHSNEHFLISKISFHRICTSFQCTNDRVCFTITWHHLE